MNILIVGDAEFKKTISEILVRLKARIAAEENPERIVAALRAIVRRGRVRYPLQRHATAKVFLDELNKWMKPVVANVAVRDEGNVGTLEFLLRRMRHKSDFPALSGSIVRIQGISSSTKRAWPA